MSAMKAKKLKPISDVPPLLVENIDKFEDEMQEKAATQSNKKFLDECREIYKKHRF